MVKYCMSECFLIKEKVILMSVNEIREFISEFLHIGKSEVLSLAGYKFNKIDFIISIVIVLFFIFLAYERFKKIQSISNENKNKKIEHHTKIFGSKDSFYKLSPWCVEEAFFYYYGFKLDFKEIKIIFDNSLSSGFIYRIRNAYHIIKFDELSNSFIVLDGYYKVKLKFYTILYFLCCFSLIVVIFLWSNHTSLKIDDEYIRYLILSFFSILFLICLSLKKSSEFISARIIADEKFEKHEDTSEMEKFFK